MGMWCGGRTQEAVVLVSKLINRAAVGKPATIVQDIFCLLKSLETMCCGDLIFKIFDTTMHCLKKLEVCGQMNGSYMGGSDDDMMIFNIY